MAKSIGISLAPRMEQSSSDDIDRDYDDMFGTSFENNIDKIVEIDTALLYHTQLIRLSLTLKKN